jgi:hypothetical protein
MPIDREQAPGFKAIKKTLVDFYGTKEEEFFFAEGNEDPLEGVSVYRSTAETPHWHYISFGFSDLEEKESESRDLSGYGFELTFRLEMKETEKTPPSWPSHLLNDLAREVFQMGNRMQAGSHMALSQPLESDCDTKLHAITIALDSELGTIKTVNGKIQFLQVVALTLDELDLLKRWGKDKFLETAKSRIGQLLITQMRRKSLCDDRSIARELEEGATKGGGSGTIDCPSAEWFFMTRASICLPQSIIDDFKKQLTERLSSGAELTIRGSECKIVFRNAREPSFSIEDSDLIIELPSPAAKALAEKLTPGSSTHNLDNIPVSIEFA